MKILISAYACEPGRGAEPGVGWNLVRELSQKHELWVMTRADHQDKVFQCGEKWIDRVHWVFIDPPTWIIFWKKGSRGLYPFYALWQVKAWKTAKRLQTEIGFDLIHHLTFGQYWVPTPLVKLPPPFVFGPVGGGESTPPGFSRHYSLMGKIREWVRDSFRRWLPVIPGLRRWYLDADWTMAATRNTEAALKRIGVSKLEVLHQSGIGNGDEVEHFWRERTPVTKSAEGILKIVTACRLVHWKAVDLAIEAVDRARKAGIPVELEILSDGPEASSLKRLVEKLDLNKVIIFSGRLPKIEDVFEQVSQADALIHPALHEAFGQSCLEAMALGTPVICLDWAGPGLIVDKKTGYAVKPEGREKTIKNLADAINRCYQDKRERTSKGEDAARRARTVFSWSGLADRINSVYLRVTD